MKRPFIAILPLIVIVFCDFETCSAPREAEPRGVVTHELAYYRPAESYTINHPFPQAEIIHNPGIRPSTYNQAEMNAHCRAAFEDWVKYWVTETNCPEGAARPYLGPGPGGCIFSAAFLLYDRL